MYIFGYKKRKLKNADKYLGFKIKHSMLFNRFKHLHLLGVGCQKNIKMSVPYQTSGQNNTRIEEAQVFRIAV